MTELKTLNDLKLDYKIHDAIIKKRLRQEAIKWVKEIKKMPQVSINEIREQIRMNDGAKQWITHFFNLTEEDLL